jgi:protein involved in polysaccharide export with SLBB domain
MRRADTLLAGLVVAVCGCHAPFLATDEVVDVTPSACVGHCGPTDCGVPRELDKVSLPRYTVAPPDILLIEAVHNLRRADALLQAADMLLIQVENTLPVDPRDGPVAASFKQVNAVYPVSADGRVDLGPEYGSVAVAGLTVAQAHVAVERHLRAQLTHPQVSLTLAQPEAKQLVSGEHLVRPDGTVSLGVYGDVYVAGLTLPQVKLQIERHLAPYIHHPEVSVDVLAYNSQWYYVVTDGGGAGVLSTGNETVLDALSHINGLPVVASKKDIWIARPQPPCVPQAPDQILEVDWDAIVRGGQTETNYQIFPGDRVYVQADHLVSFDTFVAKLTAPAERVLGFVLLGNGTVRAVQNGHRFGGDGVGVGGF